MNKRQRNRVEHDPDYVECPYDQDMTPDWAVEQFERENGERQVRQENFGQLVWAARIQEQDRLASMPPPPNAPLGWNPPAPPDLISRAIAGQVLEAEMARVIALNAELEPLAATGAKVMDGNPDGRPKHPHGELWVKLTERLVTRRRFAALPEVRRLARARTEAARLIDNYWHGEVRRDGMRCKKRRLLARMNDTGTLLGGADKDVCTKFKRYRKAFGSSA